MEAVVGCLCFGDAEDESNPGLVTGGIRGNRRRLESFRSGVEWHGGGLRETGSAAASASAGRGDSSRAAIGIMDGAALLAFLLGPTECTGIPDGGWGGGGGLGAPDASEESSSEDSTSEGVGELGTGGLSLVAGGAMGRGAGGSGGVAALEVGLDPSS